MDRVIKNTRKKFIATIILVVVLIVATTWGILQIYNEREIAAPAHSSEVHQTAADNKLFSDYLDEQKEYEAHFITLASSIKEQEAAQVTRAIAVTSVVAVIIGVIAALFAAKRLMRPVVEAYESQERFLQDAAHELRNPLAAMTAALQQTKENTPLTTIFRRQTKRLVYINEDLLYLERRERQAREILQISELLEEVIEELQPIAAKNNIRIKKEIEGEIKKYISSSDYVRLTKNVISNAIKYSKKDSAVTITQKMNKGEILFTVTDQGIGIPKNDVKHIGERFFRASNTGKIDGTGLGLAIVQKILNLYGGTIKITSRAGSGTKVSITLPT